jgi:hypothetical protein
MEPLATPQKLGVVGWAVIIVLLSLLVALLISSAEWRWAVGATVALVGVLGIIWRRQWRQLEIERESDSICRFARLLPARDHDTWVVRAVYEGLASDRGFGIRPSDRLEEDLLFVPEDVEDLVLDIAKRARRSLNAAGRNPLANRVVTVLDLVNFLEHQPKTGRA